MILHELLTPRLKLRRWELSDAAAALSVFGDPAVQCQLRTDGKYVRTEVEMKLAIETLISRPPNCVNRGELAIVCSDPSRAIGGITWNPIDSPSKSGLSAIEMSWMLSSEVWGNGYGTEAVLFLLRDMMLQIDQPIEVVSVCFPKNERAFALAHKIGMHLAGVTQTSTGTTVAVFHTVLHPAVAAKAA